MTQRSKIIAAALIIAVIAAAILYACKGSLLVAYHEWRLRSAYNSIFSGEPQPMGNGLAAWNVSASNVDAAVDAISHHRKALVETGAWCHVAGELPGLRSDGPEIESSARQEFFERLWDRFPDHFRYRHHCLDANGHFEVWAPIDQRSAWLEFIQAESTYN